MIEAATPSQALARVLVDELVRLGLEHACLAPGSRSAPLALALHERPEVRLHVGIDERSVAFLALGVARATGRPAAIVSTSGTAAVNFHPAVVEASEARVPLVVLTADRPPELRHAGANQTVDQVKLYGGAVRWFCEVGVPEALPGVAAYWRSVACRAWAGAAGAGGPAGPVHLNLALRDPLVGDGGRFDAPLDGRPGGRAWTAVTAGERVAPPERVDDLARRVRAVERGLVVAGDATLDDPTAVVALAQAAGWPLVAEPLSGARCGPNAISTYHALLADAAFAADHRPDLVVRVGRLALSRPLLGWLDAGVEQVLVDRDGAWLDPERAVAEVVAADPVALCRELAGRLAGERADGGWLASWRRAEERARAMIDAVLDAEEAPSEPRVARDLAALLPEGATLVVASSLPVRELDAFMRPRAGLRVLGNRGASGIDGFVSTALGVALGSDGPVAALAGDLSLLHDQGGFLLEQVDLVLVVLNNDGGGIFSFLPYAGGEGFEDLFGTPHGRDLGAVVGAHGAGHVLVERPGDLAAAVEAAAAAGGVQVVEVRTDRAANRALHTRALGSVV